MADDTLAGALRASLSRSAATIAGSGATAGNAAGAAAERGMQTVADDTLAAELAAIRETASQITRDGHDEAECSADLGRRCTGHDAERLLAAVEAVLARHNPVPAVRLVPCQEHKHWRGPLIGVPEFGQEFETENLRVRRTCPSCQVFDEPYCRSCLNDDGGCQDWPCKEYQAIAAELLAGKEPHRG